MFGDAAQAEYQFARRVWSLQYICHAWQTFFGKSWYIDAEQRPSSLRVVAGRSFAGTLINQGLIPSFLQPSAYRSAHSTAAVPIGLPPACLSIISALRFS